MDMEVVTAGRDGPSFIYGSGLASLLRTTRAHYCSRPSAGTGLFQRHQVAFGRTPILSGLRVASLFTGCNPRCSSPNTGRCRATDTGTRRTVHTLYHLGGASSTSTGPLE